MSSRRPLLRRSALPAVYEYLALWSPRMDKSASTAMREDCTQLFLRYREIARLVWNLGFWPDPELRAIACGLAYEDAMARLFEGMVLLGLGYGERVQSWPQGLGEPVKFQVIPRTAGAELHVEDITYHLAGGASHAWGNPIISPAFGISRPEVRLILRLEPVSTAGVQMAASPYRAAGRKPRPCWTQAH
jgi:hypothetical protein